MALADFQRAVAALVMDPAFKRRILDGGPEALEGFELTARERNRLEGLAAQGRGLEVGTLFHRSFRLTKIGYTFPRVCELLGGEALSEVLDAYWQEHPDVHEYFFQEARRFGHWLLRRCENAPDTPLEDLTAYELALVEVNLGGAEAERLVRFRCDPHELLERLASRDQPRQARAGEFWLRVRKSNGEVQISLSAGPSALRE
jgi:hypothetical protein